MQKYKYKWEKFGLLIKPNKSLYWSKSHCMIPTPYDLGNGLIKIYYSGRDEKNRSHIGFSIVDLNNGCKVIENSYNPVLCPGELGCFDDNGVTPSCVIDLNEKEIALYYIGWNPGSTVRMHLFGGLAISKDGGKTFKRWSKAPIIERTNLDPYLNTAPWVVRNEDHFRMYYVSGKEWINKNTPRYNIKTAKSFDGLSWDRLGDVAIDFKNQKENALARPFVIKDKDIWKMWFAYKGDSYNLSYAESGDGINWQRFDKGTGINKSEGEFDSEMIEYAAIVEYKSNLYMFYNGNNYGYEGIGLAISK